MMLLLGLFAVSVLCGIIFSIILHRAVKISVTVSVAAGLAAAVCPFLLLLGWSFITLMPSAQFAGFACIAMGSWFFISAIHLWAYQRAPVIFSSNSPAGYPWSLLAGLLLFIVQAFVIAASFFFVLTLDSRCLGQRNDVMIFTGHLKSLCVEQKGSGLCPKNESELRAFDPKRYKNLQRCARTSYAYEEGSGWFEWRVKFRNQEIFANPQDLPGVGTPPRD
jgi:hypothetical protein